MTALFRVNSVESAFNVLNDLREYFGVSDSLGATEKTLAVAFYAEPIGSQEQFAEQYWKFVQLLHDLDCQTFEWDNTVSPVINDTNFEPRRIFRRLISVSYAAMASVSRVA